MNENKYYVTVDNRKVAEYMTLDYALMFTKALFEKYINEHSMVIAITEMQRTCEGKSNKEVCESTEPYRCRVCGNKAKFGFVLENGDILNFCEKCFEKVGTMSDEEKNKFFEELNSKE